MCERETGTGRQRMREREKMKDKERFYDSPKSKVESQYFQLKVKCTDCWDIIWFQVNSKENKYYKLWESINNSSL